MLKRIPLWSLSVLVLTLPLTVWAANIQGKVYENGVKDTPMAQAGVKVEVFGGYGNKALLSSDISRADGSVLLRNVPLGKDILVKLTKPGYVPQVDVRSYSEGDVVEGVIFWVGSEGNLQGFYGALGDAYDAKKGHVYLEINDELTGEGIEGIGLGVSSGKVYDLGQGEYLITNAEGGSVRISLVKPGYVFDIEAATIPLFAGAMTQYYVQVQSGGAVYSSVQAAKVTSAQITGHIRRLSDAVALSGISVDFKFNNGTTAAPSVTTDSLGYYIQSGFPINKYVKVLPVAPDWKFKPKSKLVYITKKGAKADFKAY